MIDMSDLMQLAAEISTIRRSFAMTVSSCPARWGAITPPPVRRAVMAAGQDEGGDALGPLTAKYAAIVSLAMAS